jgi:hypothetical protein
MLILSQYHILEPYKINIFSAGSNKLTTVYTVLVVQWYMGCGVVVTQLVICLLVPITTTCNSSLN